MRIENLWPPSFCGRRLIMRAVVIVLGLLSLLNVARGENTAETAQSQAKAFFGALPEKMPGADKDTAEMVILGERLFNE